MAFHGNNKFVILVQYIFKIERSHIFRGGFFWQARTCSRWLRNCVVTIAVEKSSNVKVNKVFRVNTYVMISHDLQLHDPF